MKKSIAVLFTMMPIAANAGYINYQNLAPGTIELAGSLASGKTEGVLTSTDRFDVKATKTALSLGITAGIAHNVNVAFELPLASAYEFKASLNDMTATEERSGMGDLAGEVRFRFGEGSSYPVVGLGVIFPTGDDKEAVMEIKTSSDVIQPGTVGGMGEGRTDYAVTGGYFFSSDQNKGFVGIGYVMRDEKDGIDYGDRVTVGAEGSMAVSERVDLVGGLKIRTTGDTTSDRIRDKTEPLTIAKVGGMFAFSESSELIAELYVMSGGDTDFYDNAGNREGTLTIDSNTGLTLTFKSRF